MKVFFFPVRPLEFPSWLNRIVYCILVYSRRPIIYTVIYLKNGIFRWITGWLWTIYVFLWKSCPFVPNVHMISQSFNWWCPKVSNATRLSTPATWNFHWLSICTIGEKHVANELIVSTALRHIPCGVFVRYLEKATKLPATEGSVPRTKKGHHSIQFGPKNMYWSKG